MKNENFIDENNADEWLNRMFLEGNADQINEQAARFILQQEYDVKIDVNKEKQVIDKLRGMSKGQGGYLNLLIIVFVAVIGGASFFAYIAYFRGHTDSIQVKGTAHKTESLHKSIPVKGTPAALSVYPSEKKERDPIRTDEVIDENEILKRNPKFSTTDVSVYYPQTGVGSRTTATFFKPSEQDFIFYEKIRKTMLEKLLGSDKKMYSVIEKGEISYRGKSITVHPFTFGNHAITNLEYKVFLAGLIKAGKQEEFKLAVVRNETWLNYNDNILASTYFFDEKYNDFPVVNISPKAAFLFCSWLEKQLNQLAQSLDPEAEPLRVRLPFDTEWIIATKEGYAQTPDCGGYNTIYDIREGIVDNSYTKHTELIRIQGNSKRTELDDLFSVNRYGLEEDRILQLFQRGFSYKTPQQVDSLYPGRTLLFSKVAHVSEIMQEEKTGKTVIAGSCWKNKNEYTRMLKEFNIQSASPFVGFRVVVVSGKRENL